MKKKVCVTIVTYNRINYLIKLLDALSKQTYSVSIIAIVDNNSSDETPAILMENGIIKNVIEGSTEMSFWRGIQINYYRSLENTGGSGGFAQVMSMAQEYDCDYIWAMDDDVLPETDCLEHLIKFCDNSSRMCIPCRCDEQFQDYAVQKFNLTNPFLYHVNECKQNLILGSKIERDYVYVEDMAFEGPLLERKLVKEIGIPNKEYFILFDDTDYAHRALDKTRIRYVKNAKLHKQIVPPQKKGSTWSWKAYYATRNAAYFDSIYGKNFFVRNLRPRLRIADLLLRAIIRGRFYRIKWLLRAHNDGMNHRMGKTVDPKEIPARR